jgi:uncharacterized protein (DUF58 family)
MNAPGGASPTDLALARLQKAEEAASSLPPLLVAAERIAATVMQGVHGRRRMGPGNTFWQFRHYQPGDPAQRIDWRQTAKAGNVFIREKEWVAAQSVWLWCDGSPSMNYTSSRHLPPKEERAKLLTLALASLLMGAGEHVALSGEGRGPGAGRAVLARMAVTLSHAGSQQADVPPLEPLPRHAHITLLSDFLGSLEDITDAVGTYAARGLQGHLVQVLDPAEESLPFNGRIRFEGMEEEGNTLINRTETVRGQYQDRLAARREALVALAHRNGWSFTLHHTNRPAQEALLALYAAMSTPSGAQNRWASGGAKA